MRGIGTDIAIVSCMVFLAQFILSLLMGSFVTKIGESDSFVSLNIVDIVHCTPCVKYGVRSPRFSWAACAQLYSLAETPQHPPPPAILGSNTRALTVNQDRRHLFVTPCFTQNVHLAPMYRRSAFSSYY